MLDVWFSVHQRPELKCLMSHSEHLCLCTCTCALRACVPLYWVCWPLKFTSLSALPRKLLSILPLHVTSYQWGYCLIHQCVAKRTNCVMRCWDIPALTNAQFMVYVLFSVMILLGSADSVFGVLSIDQPWGTAYLHFLYGPTAPTNQPVWSRAIMGNDCCAHPYWPIWWKSAFHSEFSSIEFSVRENQKGASEAKYLKYLLIPLGRADWF